jgi:iron complex outermembrane recepter protein
MKFNFLIAFMSLICVHLCGQTKVRGEVFEAISGQPIIGATVLIEGTTEGAVTEWDGSFEIATDRTPPFNLVVSYLGFNTITIPYSDTKNKLKINLEEETIQVTTVEVVGQRISDKQKQAPLTVESLDAIAIKQTASTDFYNGLGALKGVDLTTASLGFTVINTRGFNSTSPVRSLQVIDGVDNQSPGLNFSLGNFLGAAELDVLKVDLVVGASSAFYGPNAFNGVIAMETKNPFFHKGLAASVKVGERSLVETGFRFADAIKNKEGKAYFAYKANFSYLRAYDWVADNYNPVSNSLGNRVFDSNINPGGSNGVNVYGDEYFASFATLYDARAGLNTFHRKGYNEKDLVDYNTRNIKAGVSLHFRTNPSKDYESPELVLSSNFGYGTTVYQGENRFSLRGIQFYQHKIEFRKKDKYFIRGYMTHEDAGDSYDPYFTAQKMIEAASTNEQWQNAYSSWWSRNDLGAVFKKMKEMGYPADGFDAQIKWQQDNKGILDEWHKKASDFANTQNSLYNSKNFFEPGTARFDSLFKAITSAKNNQKENGTRFFDQSALFHLHGEYKIASNYFKDVVIGANGRMYRPFSEGTIFNDTTQRITNTEFGVYGGASKELGDFILSTALRVDKNQNFRYLVSPAASMVYKPSQNNYLRLSFSSAIRNPTLSDQYLNLRVGPARLIGNLTGFDSLVTLESFNIWRNDQSKPFVYRNIDPIRPEQVKTGEIGYRTTLFEKLFLDMSAYSSWYKDFIGYQVGLEIPEVLTEIFPGGPKIPLKQYANTRVLRIAANATETVRSEGFSIGYNLYFNKYFALNGNYSYNKLATKAQDTVLVPAFNTPRNKYNVGISGRDIPVGTRNLFGFNVNYKWVQGFTFEGSPQFTGLVPSYDLVDAQVNYTVPKLNLVFKLGASNLLNNKQFQTYGGPRIGRMAYFTITYDFKEKI